ncbi:MAG: phosphoglycerate mutase [Ramlibacter sp.]|nr:phosphoglycerate mutase [Ramlibacter sp.]
MGEGCAQALRTLELPHLEKLLARLAPGQPEAGSELTLSMPCERVLARESGLAFEDGRIPWAAWQVREAGGDAGDRAWAFITPCHWRVGTGHVAMDHPHHLRLAQQHSKILLAAMQPYFEADGIALAYDAPTRWLAQGDIFRGLPTASLDRVVGRTIDDWMPRTPQAGPLRRLQQEMQMLLYTHEVNDERARAGLQPVNSFWISGTGALPPAPAAMAPPGPQIANDLRDAALLGDWDAWAAAWKHLDATECPRLLQALHDGRPVTLTLCGERSARTWSSAGAGILRRLAAPFARRQAAMLLEPL